MPCLLSLKILSSKILSDYILFDKLALPIIESFIKIGFLVFMVDWFQGSLQMAGLVLVAPLIMIGIFT